MIENHKCLGCCTCDFEPETCRFFTETNMWHDAEKEMPPQKLEKYLCYVKRDRRYENGGVLYEQAILEYSNYFNKWEFQTNGCRHYGTIYGEYIAVIAWKILPDAPNFITNKIL
jgi:hypothetical protein